MKIKHVVLGLCLISATSAFAQTDDERGAYFYKKNYIPTPLPEFEQIKEQLPAPIFDENPQWIQLYWKAWEIAFSNLKAPEKGSPLVSNWIDEGLSPQIFQWDTHFMALFGRYAFYIFPFIESHDNFYARQHNDGMICRVINESDGTDHYWGLGENFARTINPPLFSWAEMENYKFTKDQNRLSQILVSIEKYVEWVEQHRKAVNTEHQLYWSNGQASGMDNTPRDIGRTPTDGDIHSSTDAMGWVDMSCQIKMCYDNLSQMCTILGEKSKAKCYKAKADALAERINNYLWDEQTGLYYDVDANSKRTSWITSATFWPILADVATPHQIEKLVHAIQNEELFWRLMPLPSLAANQPYYDKCGNYWRGGVWAPTTYMTVKGLEKYGYGDLATTIAQRNMDVMTRVYESTGTIWELYAPDMYMPATTATGIHMVKPNFVGWSGLIPISMFIENILGFSANGTSRTLTWQTTRTTKHGIKNLHFADVVTTAVREGDFVTIESNAPYKLILNGQSYQVKKGSQTIDCR